MSVHENDWFDDDLSDDFWLNNQQQMEEGEERGEAIGAGVSPAKTLTIPPPPPSVLNQSNRDDWFSDENDEDNDYDTYYNNENDVDDPDSSLPAGQGMNFSNVSLSPVSSTLVPSQTQDFLPSEAFASLFKKPLTATAMTPSTSKKRKLDEPGKKSRSRSVVCSTPLPSFAPSVSWPDLLRQHEELMASKGKISARKFNKTALDMLNACVTFAREGIDPCSTAGVAMIERASSLKPASSVKPTSASAAFDSSMNAGDWTEEKEALGEFRSLLLNQKEQTSEDLVDRILAFIQRRLPPLMTADEKKEAMLKRSMNLVMELSPQLSIKIGPIVKSAVSRLFDSQLESLFAEIHMPEMSLQEKAVMYCRMLSNFIDDPSCVTFATTNKQLLGKLLPVDVWFLTFFVFVTARRVRGDNLLMLGLVGECFSFFLPNLT